MDEEYKSLMENGTYKSVRLPIGKKALSNRWVYKIKRSDTGTLLKRKARLVAKGYLQREGVDYEETFALVA